MSSSTMDASGRCSDSQYFWDLATWVGRKLPSWEVGAFAGAHHCVKGVICLKRGAMLSTREREGGLNTVLK
jgi:hypothetical protein